MRQADLPVLPLSVEQEALDTAVEISERAEPEAAADLDQERQEVSLEVGALVAALRQGPRKFLGVGTDPDPQPRQCGGGGR